MGLGAGGAGREGIVLAEPGAAAPGGLGAGRLGTRDPLTCGEFGTGDVRLRGIGGGARGFSKLSRSFRGKRGLWGGLRRGCTEP